MDELYHSFPNSLEPDKYEELKCFFNNDDILVANMLYLEAHGLIISGLNETMSGYYINSSVTKITAKGIDFIQHDGGLSAILNVHTIKFHRDAVVVLEDLITISGFTDAEKVKAKSALAEMTTEAIKTVVQTATSAGLSILMK
ncbi:hypothetical protein AL522_08990 [Pantoea vagans]|nr:hypothetical protein AL522_08990 [Pantoea vagans]